MCWTTRWARTESRASICNLCGAGVGSLQAMSCCMQTVWDRGAGALPAPVILAGGGSYSSALLELVTGIQVGAASVMPVAAYTYAGWQLHAVLQTGGGCTLPGNCCFGDLHSGAGPL